MALLTKAIQPDGLRSTWTLNCLMSVKIGQVSAFPCSVISFLPVMEQMIFSKEKWCLNFIWHGVVQSRGQKGTSC